MKLEIHIDTAAEMRLQKFARETGRTVEELAESAVEEAALAAFRTRSDDPAKPSS